MGSLGTYRGKKINYEVLFLFLYVHGNLKYLHVYTNKKYQSLASSLLSVKTKATSLYLQFPNCSAAWKVNNRTCGIHPLSAHTHIGSLYILIYIERETYVFNIYYTIHWPVQRVKGTQDLEAMAMHNTGW